MTEKEKLEKKGLQVEQVGNLLVVQIKLSHAWTIRIIKSTLTDHDSYFIARGDGCVMVTLL